MLSWQATHQAIWQICRSGCLLSVSACEAQTFCRAVIPVSQHPTSSIVLQDKASKQSDLQVQQCPGESVQGGTPCLSV